MFSFKMLEMCRLSIETRAFIIKYFYKFLFNGNCFSFCHTHSHYHIIQVLQNNHVENILHHTGPAKRLQNWIRSESFNCSNVLLYGILDYDVKIMKRLNTLHKSEQIIHMFTFVCFIRNK